MQNLVIPEISRLKYNGQEVFTTWQLAQIFKCRLKNITDNFKHEKTEFISEVDYFFVGGQELTKLKRAAEMASVNLEAVGLTSHVTNTYLWTRSGVTKISKTIGTKEAKLIYSSFEFGYLEKQVEHSTPNNPPAKKQVEHSTPNNPPATLEVVNALLKAAEITRDDQKREKLIDYVFELLTR